jgi:uncharacterized lipoprotein YmbA
MFMDPKLRQLIPLLVALALAGCASSPPTRFYTLEPVPPARPAAALAGAPVTVDAVNVPGLLDREQIVRRSGPNQVDLAGTDRWAAPFDSMARRVLARDLAARLPAQMVLLPGEPSPGGPKRSIVVDIEDFAGDVAGRVVLDARWTLLSGEPSKPVLRRREHIEETAAGPGYDADAAAMSRALGALADRIAAALAASS